MQRGRLQPLKRREVLEVAHALRTHFAGCFRHIRSAEAIRIGALAGGSEAVQRLGESKEYRSIAACLAAPPPPETLARVRGLPALASSEEHLAAAAYWQRRVTGQAAAGGHAAPPPAAAEAPPPSAAAAAPPPAEQQQDGSGGQGDTWFYLDHTGREQGPFSLCALKVCATRAREVWQRFRASHMLFSMYSFGQLSEIKNGSSALLQPCNSAQIHHLSSCTHHPICHYRGGRRR